MCVYNYLTKDQLHDQQSQQGGHIELMSCDKLMTEHKFQYGITPVKMKGREE